MTVKQFNALTKKALSFGLTQTKKEFRRLKLIDVVEADGEVALAKFRLEVSDHSDENREFINVQIEKGEIRTRKTKNISSEGESEIKK